MQFASAVTEYVLPGLPLIAVLVYGADVLTPLSVRDLLASGEGPAVALALGMPLLAAAYLLGVIIHCMARSALLPWYNHQERKAWERFRLYCEPRLRLLGPTACCELATLESDQLDRDGTGCRRSRDGVVLRFLRAVLMGRVPDEQADDVAGWVLWRMRLLLCTRAPGAAQEVLQLQAISRAARGAFSLPLSLFVWVVASIGAHLLTASGASQAASNPTGWPLLMALLVLVLALTRAVRWTYSYRWGVVCRATIAAFLSLDNNVQR